MVAGIAFVGVMVYDVIQINQLHAVAIANRSAGFANPRNWVMIAAALGLVAGLLLGMGIALPDKTFKARYKELRSAEENLAAKEAGFNGASAVNTTAATVDDHVTDPRQEPETR